MGASAVSEIKHRKEKERERESEHTEELEKKSTASHLSRTESLMNDLILLPTPLFLSRTGWVM